jgi:hypothetical protein
MKLTLNTRPVKEAAEKAFRDTVLLLGGEFTKAISDPVYSWPFGESPRDIVDTGLLRRSQRYQFTAKYTALYQWPTEYAAAVHNGAILKNGTRLPARKWTERAFQKMDVEAVYGRLYQRYAQ